jgi:hypothetical protein
LSPEDKKHVIEGRQKPTDQNTSQGGGGLACNLSNVVITNTETDNQSQLTGTIGTMTQCNALEQSILQGTIQGSAVIGNKRSNTDSAGSQNDPKED